MSTIRPTVRLQWSLSQEAIVEQMRAEIARDYGLHMDDDRDEIDGILLEDVIGTELEGYLT